VAVSRRSGRHRSLLILLILTSITVVTLDERGTGSGVLRSIRSGARDAFAPVASAADSVVSPVGNFFSGMFHYGSLRSENARLRRQLDEARSQGLQAADAERELAQLRQIDQLGFAGGVPSVAARVVSSSPTNFQVTAEIDKGSAAGIARDMPVVTGAGLVGRIVDVSRNRAVILLLTDPASKVGIRLSTSGDLGLVTGAGARQGLPVSLVENATKVPPGEVLVTSGVRDSPFPPGVPVARVRSAHSVTNALEQDVVVDPVVDLTRLEYVRVLQWKP
jgi:rod shape-determining protein MreC